VNAPDSRTARITGLVPSLSDRHVLVVGCGSVGSTIADVLVRHGVGTITLVDPDEVEAPNLSRSTYTGVDRGRPKVDALADHLLRIDPGTSVTGHHCELDALLELQLADLLQQVDLVVGTLDDPVAQGALDHRATAIGRPVVHCALYRGAAAGEIVVNIPGATPCWACATGQRATSHGADGEHLRGEQDYGTGRLAAETALGADILTVVSVAAKLSIGLLCGPSSPVGAHTLTAIARHSMCIIATSAGWEWFPANFGETPGQFAPQSVWLRVLGSSECPVCGEHRVAPQAPLGDGTAAGALASFRSGR
jgi:hypothetical protein